MVKLIFGCGYLGRRVAQHWLAAGHTVYAVTRSAEHARQFEQDGLRPIVADVTDPQSLAGLPAAETVLLAVGYDRAAGRSIEEVYVAGLRHVLDRLPEATGRLIYVSSTGVYGPTHGDVFDEESPCEPQRDGGRACLAAERLLAEHPLGGRSIVLRLAGIYGPGRIPLSSQIVAGEPLAVPVDGYLNLIHVEDAAQTVLAAAERATPPRTFVVSDGHPVVRRAYYEELARLLHAPPPRFCEPAADSAALARSRVDKQVSNARMLRELGVPLKYPSYRAGLAAIVVGEDA